jgi:hypothetical protein
MPGAAVLEASVQVLVWPLLPVLITPLLLGKAAQEQPQEL